MKKRLYDRIKTLVNIYDLNNEKGYARQLKALREEVDELIDALNQNNIIQVLDAIGDSLFVAATLEIIETEKGFKEHELTVSELMEKIDAIFNSLEFEFSAEDVLEEVVRSNESKFDYTPFDASRTAEYYLGMGIPTVIKDFILKEEGKVIYYLQVEDDTVVCGKKFFKGKFLKSHINYIPPNFTKFLL